MFFFNLRDLQHLLQKKAIDLSRPDEYLPTGGKSGAKFLYFDWLDIACICLLIMQEYVRVAGIFCTCHDPE